MENLLPSLTVLLIFACLVAYEYIKSLKSELKATKKSEETGWRLHESTNAQLLQLQGKHVPTERMYPDEKADKRKPEPFVPAGIGPSAIADRELRRERRTPSSTDIDAAATEATSEAAN